MNRFLKSLLEAAQWVENFSIFPSLFTVINLLGMFVQHIIRSLTVRPHAHKLKMDANKQAQKVRNATTATVSRRNGCSSLLRESAGKEKMLFLKMS